MSRLLFLGIFLGFYTVNIPLEAMQQAAQPEQHSKKASLFNHPITKGIIGFTASLEAMAFIALTGISLQTTTTPKGVLGTTLAVLMAGYSANILAHYHPKIIGSIALATLIATPITLAAADYYFFNSIK